MCDYMPVRNLKKTLRILVVPPFYGGSLPPATHCAQALAAMGHLVETFDAPAFNSGYHALRDLKIGMERLEYLENAFLQFIGQAVVSKVEAFEPDLVLALAQAPLSRQTLRKLRKDKVVTTMWFVEDYRVFPYWRAYAPLYDFFAVIQKEPFLGELKAIGVENALYLPNCAAPTVHRPLDLSPAERRRFGSDLSFMGAGYPNRRLAFRHFVGRDFKIWGTEWDGDPILEPYVQEGGRRISTDEAVKIYNATKINLNLHSSLNAKSLVEPGDFVNPRTFEVAACGGFQLTDRRSLLPELYADDEMASFGSFEELLDLIPAFLADPERRAAFIAKAQSRTLAEHTYAHRMETLLAFITQRRPGWGRETGKDDDGLSALPPELRPEIAALLSELGLPVSVSFNDLIRAIRGRHGQLGASETALLFLDEWRNQYGVN